MAEQNYDLAVEQLKQMKHKVRGDRQLLSINTQANIKSKNGDAAVALAAVDKAFARRSPQMGGSGLEAERKLSPVGLYLMRIELLMHLQRYGEAADDCAKVLAENPDHTIAMEKHVVCYEQLLKLANKKGWIE